MSELQVKKVRLEEAIQQAFIQFEEDTGLTVTEIVPSAVWGPHGSGTKIVRVKAELT